MLLKSILLYFMAISIVLCGALIGVTKTSSTKTDYQCFYSCMKKGSTYGYCKQFCSY